MLAVLAELVVIPYVLATAGGVLIGLAASLLWLADGKIAGISGLLREVLSQRPWRAWEAWLFLLGLLSGGVVLGLFAPSALAGTVAASPATVLFAGVLVGAGTALGSGCTSGHGVCGLSQASPRSLAATVTFLGVGMVVATLVGTFAGGAS